MGNPFRDFNGAPAKLRLAPTMIAKVPPTLRNVGDLVSQRG